MSKVKIAPSILAADFLNLGKDIEIINKYADIIHFDVMDGLFVPNISFGFPVVEPVAKIARKPLDVHLMIVHPERYIERFAQAGASMISFHIEAVHDPEPVIGLIKNAHKKAGIVLNPDTPVEKVFPYLDLCDYVLIMSVYAGFGGQKLIEATFDRVRALRAEIDSRKLNCRIEVDGGVTLDNAAALREAGVDIIVAGSTVFRAENPAAAIASLRK